MFNIIADCARVLTPASRKKAAMLTFLDIVASLLDIGFLIWLLFLAAFFTGSHPGSPHSPFLLGLGSHHPVLLAAVFLLLFACKNFFAFQVMKWQLQFVYEVASELSSEKIIQYLQGQYSDYVNTDSSVFLNRTGEQPIQFAHYVLWGLQQAASQAALILFSVTALVIYNAALFLLLLLVLLPAFTLVSFILKKKLSAVANGLKPAGQTALQHLKEALEAFVESNLYQKERFFSQRYARAQRQFNGLLSQQLVIRNIPSRMTEVFMVFGFAALVVFEAAQGNPGAPHILIVGAFVAAAYKIIPGIAKIHGCLNQVKTYSFTVGDLLNSSRPPEREHLHDKSALPLTSVAFSHVSFNFADQPVLNDFSFSFRCGELVGLSGLSGGGKTTVVNLLLGFLPLHEGAILLNGHCSSADERHALWDQIAYVKQQPLLIHDTLVNNITLDPTGYDHLKLAQVLEVTGLRALLDADPEGPRKIITEHGKNLSGGERQRIALARALYKDAPFMILDEPFSELDDQSERMLLRHLRTLAQGGRMVLLITHQKESLSYCHKSISFDERKWPITVDFDTWVP